MTTSAQDLPKNAEDLATTAQALSEKASEIAAQASQLLQDAGSHGDGFLVSGITVFALACFVGYYVVWRVTPALHSPLMAMTNAVSSVIIVGALLAVGAAETGFSQLMGFLAVVLASINIFGGFIVTRRMLHMFKKKS